MRSRNIKPSLFKNEILGVADPILTVVFAGLWCAADREGRVEDRPLRLKAEILPYRENIDFNGYLTELDRLEFICRYTVENKAVIQVLNFKKHQNPHKTEKPSELPEMPEKTSGCDLTVKAPLNNGSRPADSFNLIPDSLIPEDNGAKKTPRKKFNPHSIRPGWMTEKQLDDLIAHRKAHKNKPPQTEAAFTSLFEEIFKATGLGFSIDDCIGKMANRGWQGFEAAWMHEKNNSGEKKTFSEIRREKNIKAMKEFAGD